MLTIVVSLIWDVISSFFFHNCFIRIFFFFLQLGSTPNLWILVLLAFIRFYQGMVPCNTRGIQIKITPFVLLCLNMRMQKSCVWIGDICRKYCFLSFYFNSFLQISFSSPFQAVMFVWRRHMLEILILFLVVPLKEYHLPLKCPG